MLIWFANRSFTIYILKFMLNSENITQNRFINDQLINEVELDDNQALVDRHNFSPKLKSLKDLPEDLKLKEKLGDSKLDKLFQEKQSNKKCSTNKLLFYCFEILIVAMIFVFLFEEKSVLRYFFTSFNDEPKVQIHPEQKFQSQEALETECQNPQRIFRVYYNEKDKQMKNLNQIAVKEEQCQFPVFGYWDLQELNEKWNMRYSQNSIFLNDVEEDWRKEQLLVLYRLYFYGGTYINVTVPYDSISNSALKYVLNGLEPIFADYTEKTQKNVYVPDARKFMKVRFAYSPPIRAMIQKLSKNEDYLERCRERQCLIAK